MYVHRSGIPEVVKAPHLVQQLVSGKDSVGGGGQVIEQLHLLGGRVHPLAVHQQLVGIHVDHQLVKGQLLPPALVAAVPAEDGVDTGHDLLHLEGFHDIVIRPHLQAGHLVLQLAFGSHHDDGRLAGLTDLSAHAPAVQHGEHDVQQHQVRRKAVEQGHPLAAVCRHLRLEALLLQIELEQLGNIAVVFHNKHFDGHRIPLFLQFHPIVTL